MYLSQVCFPTLKEQVEVFHLHVLKLGSAHYKGGVKGKTKQQQKYLAMTFVLLFVDVLLPLTIAYINIIYI